MRAFSPGTIFEALRIARLQESQWQSNAYKQKMGISGVFTPKTGNGVGFGQGSSIQGTRPPLLPTPVPKGTQSLSKEPQRRYIPADVRAQKIAQGLCYYCDQKYDKKSQM